MKYPKPVGKRVLVKPILEEGDLKIVIPESAKERVLPERGKVMCLGGTTTPKGEPPYKYEVKVGDVVLFKPYSAHELEIEGGQYLVVDVSDLLGILCE